MIKDGVCVDHFPKNSVCTDHFPFKNINTNIVLTEDLVQAAKDFLDIKKKLDERDGASLVSLPWTTDIFDLDDNSNVTSNLLDSLRITTKALNAYYDGKVKDFDLSSLDFEPDLEL